MQLARIRRSIAMCRLGVSAALVSWIALCACPKAEAQDGRRGELALEDVLRAVMTSGPDVQRAQRNVARAEGEQRIAAGAFAAQLESFVTLADERAPSQGETSERTLSYGVSAAKPYRFGVVVRPVLSATRIERAGAAPAYLAEASLGVTLPLLRGRGGGAAVASERAAEAEVEAAVFTLNQSTAAEVLAAASAYWQYRAAAKRLEVLAESEARALRLVAETEALVAADERPPADLDQLRANAALKRSQRIGAEQALLEQRRVLGLAMGIAPAEIEALPLPATPFPEPLPEGPELDSLLARLTAGAAERRWDLAAAARRHEAGRERLSGAWAELRPRFDLTFEIAYAGLETGAHIGALTPPFQRNVTGPSTRLFATYQMAPGNPVARGLLEQREAVLDQLAIDEAEVRRSVRTGLAVASVAVRNSLGQLREVAEAVAHARRAVEGEVMKFRLGMSTQFDLIFAEDALTSSLLAEIEAQVRYAEAIARLRFESGTMLDRDAAAVSLDVSRLLDLRAGPSRTQEIR